MPVGRADLGRGRELLAAGRERPGDRPSARNACSASVVAALRWLARGAAIASGSVMPRSRRLMRICSTVVMIVAPPGRADREERPAVAHHDRRRHRRARALAAGGQVRVARARAVGAEVEVGQLVVEQEAVAGHDDAAAAGLLDREGVRDDVAAAVGRRSGAWSSRRAWPTRWCRRRRGARRRAGRRRRPALGRRVGPIRRRARRRSASDSRPLERDADERRVADVAPRSANAQRGTPRGSGAGASAAREPAER